MIQIKTRYMTAKSVADILTV